MPVTITPLLAERLDISEERTRSLLKSMLQELRNRAESDGVQLSELGTFREEDGTLTFVPSDSLRRRVNHQFEGLSPEDLAAPPSSESETEPPPTLRESSDDTDHADASTEEPAVEEEEPSPPEEAPERGAPEDESTPTTDPVEQEDEPPSSPVPEEPAGPPQAPDASEDTTEDRKESIPTIDPIEDDTETGDMRREDDSEEPPPPPEDEAEADKEPDRSPMGSFSVIGSLVLIVILAVVGWFVFSETNPWSSAERPAPDESPETTQSAEPSSKEQASEPAPDANETPDDEQPQRYPGVKPGDENEQTVSTPGTGNWTIVVASRTSQAEAEATTDAYEDQFDIVNVVPGTVNNTTWYRVTVGRYDSEAAAESALDDHASVLPDDAWTHQLR